MPDCRGRKTLGEMGKPVGTVWFYLCKTGTKTTSLIGTVMMRMGGRWITFTESLIHIGPYFESFTVLTNLILTLTL